MALKVEFKRSAKTLEWDGRVENILELAEENNIAIESECQQGYCGTWKVKLLSGEVDMERTDGLDNEDIQQNMILPCIAVPKTDVVIDD